MTLGNYPLTFDVAAALAAFTHPNCLLVVDLKINRLIGIRLLTYLLTYLLTCCLAATPMTLGNYPLTFDVAAALAAFTHPNCLLVVDLKINRLIGINEPHS
ncbi:hypothetical protein EGX44_01050 [Yersinia pseudotuberculosis]|nr:hypothetical protein EGX44_01050 [Yersinia pseudotuberculosis]